jgi:hypothetical protein
MAFQPHETYLEREVRALKYAILRLSGCSVKDAHKIRDWTYPKVMMIVRGEATPCFLKRIQRKELNNN